MIAGIRMRIADRDISLKKALGLCANTIDNELFTAMRFHTETMEVERLHSTLPDIYPVNGRKPKRDTAWGEKVLIQQQVNNGFGAEDIKWAFSDHETILGLGLNAVLNIPVVRSGKVLGTINFLRQDSAFSLQEVVIGKQVAVALSRRADL
ncbi:GAF domain-containing protein (plasmid) [Sulfitobacter sp. W027]|uniref:GAF domain-containing protein n=1 Tax=Sulfitobacter sp. W027 TaxID=2867025 RepID=UPI0021A6A6EE|nr:GAF domain-containing protein [Sulfitobacter sp. W027]UWR35196.1 GAF domain-containing protein [Sulfitobacter sp. W027]